MTKTPNQLKNIIEDWIKLINARYIDTTEIIKKQAPNIDWQFVINDKLHVSLVGVRRDRVLIHISIGMSPQIKEKFIVTEKYNQDIIHSINGFLVSLDLSSQWEIKENHVEILDIKSYIDIEELTRPIFYKKWDKLINVGNHIAITIGRRILPLETGIAQTTDTSDKTMYG